MNRDPRKAGKIILTILRLFFMDVVVRSSISLAGKWRVALDSSDEGILKRWYKGILKDTASLPAMGDNSVLQGDFDDSKLVFQF